MENKIKLKVLGLTNSQVQSGAYALVLAEEGGLHRIPIIIGTPEAQSIAIALEGLKPPRPLTHDLFATFTQAFGIQLLQVFIYRFEDGVFYSELMFTDGQRNISIDSRTSDAIAIAIRTKCDIYTTKEIVREAGIVLEGEPGEDGEDDTDAGPVDADSQDTLEELIPEMSYTQLKEELNKAIRQEDYELAQLIKNEMFRREEAGETH